MVEKVTRRGFSPVELMRSVASNFDDNVIIAGSQNDELISGGTSMALLGKKATLLSHIQFILASGISSSSDLLEQENMQLRSENVALRDAIRRIEERLAVIEASLPKEKVVVLREVSREQAKAEIQSLFARGKTLYYSDIAERLGLDLRMVVEICNELQKSGEIEVIDDALRTG
ncbi:MAG: hypothetical protein HY665_06220 [Chloroflexi bacterium]|nr:hypothetical protein [Chloroflexota bacterium]